MKDLRKDSVPSYCMKRALAFVLIYLIAAVLVEAVIIGVCYVFGYDVLNGCIPEGDLGGRIPLYGMAGFALVTIWYVKHIEKWSLSEIGIEWNRRLVVSIFKGIGIGVLMVVSLIAILLVSGVGTFQGLGNRSVSSLLLWSAAYLIQSATEEIMCRGFLYHTLRKRVKQQYAILISSIAFILPHMSGICEIGGLTMVVSLFNLAFVSWLFTVIMIRERSLGASCGLHFGWNYCLGIVFGLGVSGGNSIEGVFRIMVNPEHKLLTGGMYGLEASLMLMPELLFVILICTYGIKRRRIYGV